MKGGTRKRGKKWYYYFDVSTVDGKRKKIERVGGNTKKEAEAALRNAINEYERKGSYSKETNISFSDYLDYWFKEYVEVNCKYNTISRYETAIRVHIKPSLGIYKLKNITPYILQEFFNNKFKDGYSKKTLNVFYGILSSSLKMAVYPYEFINDDPIRYIKMPKYNNLTLKNVEEKLKIISLEEFDAICDRFPQGTPYYIPFMIGFYTGMRIGEVTALSWDDIDLENKTISVTKNLVMKDNGEFDIETPKTKSSIRTISIGDTLVKTLKKHKTWQIENRFKYYNFYNVSDFVCTKEDGSIVTKYTISYAVKVINKELHIPFSFHSLRHTHATILLENSANIKDIQVRLGHSNIKTTMDTYSHVTEKMSLDSVNIFERAVK